MANQKRKSRKWTQADEDRLIANVKNNVTNLTKAFKVTSKEIGRTEKACCYHWYRYTSKGKHTLLITMSGKHLSVNRKNGKGKPSSLSLYKRILSFLGLSL